MYLQFLSFLQTDMTQVFEILSQVRQQLTYSTLPISWVMIMGDDTRSLGISNHVIDLVKPGELGPHMLSINLS